MVIANGYMGGRMSEVGMKLKHLEQIAAICSAGSLNGAARRLGVSQPTLSKSIARLEADLGVRLFNRTHARASPTIYGRFIAEHAATLLRDAAELDDELKRMVQGEAGEVRIAAGPAARLQPLPHVISELARTYPRLRIRTRYAGPNRMMHALREGAIDLVFCHREVATAHEDLFRVKVFEDKYITVARPGHPAHVDAPLTPAKLCRFRLASAGATPDFTKWLGDTGRHQQALADAFVSDDYDLIKRMALHANFIARGPRFAFAAEMREKRLREIPLDATFQYECWMVTTASLWRSSIIKSVATFAKGALKKPRA